MEAIIGIRGIDRIIYDYIRYDRIYEQELLSKTCQINAVTSLYFTNGSRKTRHRFKYHAYDNGKGNWCLVLDWLM